MRVFAPQFSDKIFAPNPYAVAGQEIGNRLINLGEEKNLKAEKLKKEKEAYEQKRIQEQVMLNMNKVFSGNAMKKGEKNLGTVLNNATASKVQYPQDKEKVIQPPKFVHFFDGKDGRKKGVLDNMSVIDLGDFFQEGNYGWTDMTDKYGNWKKVPYDKKTGKWWLTDLNSATPSNQGKVLDHENLAKFTILPPEVRETVERLGLVKKINDVNVVDKREVERALKGRVGKNPNQQNTNTDIRKGMVNITNDLNKGY